LYACLATYSLLPTGENIFQNITIKSKERTVILEHSSGVRQGLDPTFFFTEN
jgi:hypothetical protein